MNKKKLHEQPTDKVKKSSAALLYRRLHQSQAGSRKYLMRHNHHLSLPTTAREPEGAQKENYGGDIWN